MELFQPFGILMGILTLAIIIMIQVFLSKRKSNWPGLILPILAFVIGGANSVILPTQMGWFPIIIPIILAIFLFAIHILLRRNRRPPISDELRQMRAQDL